MTKKIYLITASMFLFIEDQTSECHAEKFTHNYRNKYESESIEKFNKLAENMRSHYVKRKNKHESKINKINQEKYTLEQKHGWSSTRFQSPQDKEELKKREGLLPEYIINIKYNLERLEKKKNNKSEKEDFFKNIPYFLQNGLDEIHPDHPIKRRKTSEVSYCIPPKMLKQDINISQELSKFIEKTKVNLEHLRKSESELFKLQKEEPTPRQWNCDYSKPQPTREELIMKIDLNLFEKQKTHIDKVKKLEYKLQNFENLSNSYHQIIKSFKEFINPTSSKTENIESSSHTEDSLLGKRKEM